MGRTRKVITEQELDSDTLSDELAVQRIREREMLTANEGVTIFDLSAADEKKIEKVHVFRKDPPEGFLGEASPSISETEIVSRWGGSEYRLEGKNSKGQVVKVATKIFAGDPVFVSEIFEARWRRANGLKPRADGPAAVSPDHMSMKDMLMLMNEQAAARRAEERERIEATRHDELEREERRRKDQDERDERRAKDEAEREERARRLRTEEEDRRRSQHREDMERAAAQAALLMQQQAQMFQATFQMLKADNDKAQQSNPVDMLTKGVELALALRQGDGDNGGPQDPMTAIAARLPEILGEVRQVGGAIANEVRERRANKRGGGKRDKTPADAAATGESGTPLSITGPLADKLRQVAANLTAAGKDPEAEFTKLAAFLLAKQQGRKQAGAAEPEPGYTPPKRRRSPRRQRAASEAPTPTRAPMRRPVTIVRPKPAVVPPAAPAEPQGPA
jgi:flagellar biosynthesis GTPase FlhF